MSIQTILDLAEAQGIEVGLNEYGQLQIDASKSGLSLDDAFIWTAQFYRFYTEIVELLRDTVKQRARNDCAREKTNLWLCYIMEQARMGISPRMSK